MTLKRHTQATILRLEVKPDGVGSGRLGGPRGPARGRLRRSLGGRGARRPARPQPRRGGSWRAGGRSGSERGSGARGSSRARRAPVPAAGSDWFGQGAARRAAFQAAGAPPAPGSPRAPPGARGDLFVIVFFVSNHSFGPPRGLLSPPTLPGLSWVSCVHHRQPPSFPECPRPSLLPKASDSESWGGAPGSCILSKRFLRHHYTGGGGAESRRGGKTGSKNDCWQNSLAPGRNPLDACAERRSLPSTPHLQEKGVGVSSIFS